MTESFDAAQFKAGQRRIWDEVAGGWKQWFETFERGAQVLSDRLLELAQVAPGKRVLDVATGTGEPSVSAARRVGPTGRVVASDQSPQMLAIARQRAAAQALQNMEFHQADAEALDLPQETFDAIVCRWGLMYLPNLHDALSALRLLLVPGGRLAAAVWGAPPDAPILSLIIDTFKQHIDIPPPAPGAPGPFSLADAEALRRNLTDAGFTEVRSEPVTVTFEWDSAGDFSRFHLAVSAPFTAMVAHLPAEQRAEIWDAVTKAVAEYAASDGTVRMPSTVICVAGQR